LYYQAVTTIIRYYERTFTATLKVPRLYFSTNRIDNSTKQQTVINSYRFTVHYIVQNTDSILYSTTVLRYKLENYVPLIMMSHFLN